MAWQRQLGARKCLYPKFSGLKSTTTTFSGGYMGACVIKGEAACKETKKIKYIKEIFWEE